MPTLSETCRLIATNQTENAVVHFHSPQEVETQFPKLIKALKANHSLKSLTISSYWSKSFASQKLYKFVAAIINHPTLTSLCLPVDQTFNMKFSNIWPFITKISNFKAGPWGFAIEAYACERNKLLKEYGQHDFSHGLENITNLTYAGNLLPKHLQNLRIAQLVINKRTTNEILKLSPISDNKTAKDLLNSLGQMNELCNFLFSRNELPVDLHYKKPEELIQILLNFKLDYKARETLHAPRVTYSWTSINEGLAQTKNSNFFVLFKKSQSSQLESKSSHDINEYLINIRRN